MICSSKSLGFWTAEPSTSQPKLASPNQKKAFWFLLKAFYTNDLGWHYTSHITSKELSTNSREDPAEEEYWDRLCGRWISLLFFHYFEAMKSGVIESGWRIPAEADRAVVSFNAPPDLTSSIQCSANHKWSPQWVWKGKMSNVGRILGEGWQSEME